MGVRVLSEHWVPVREMFVLICSTRSGSWTFCLDQATLEELDDEAADDQTGVYDALRPEIYRVLRNRIAAGDPPGCYFLSAPEIRKASRPTQAIMIKSADPRH